VTKEALSRHRIFLGEYVKVALSLVIGILLLALLRRFVLGRGTKRMVPLYAEVAIVVSVGMLAAVIFHSTSRIGFIPLSRSKPAIEQLDRQIHLSTVPAERLKELLGDVRYLFLDARLPERFTAGHLPGAVSMPFGTPETNQYLQVSSIPKSTRIITYCDPKGCPLAARLALMLREGGFENVQELTGDWTPYQVK
jgi:rhodanese-related sulfurtransferase